jgi:RNA polymerase sigma-70 factor (ECF subfamily)
MEAQSKAAGDRELLEAVARGDQGAFQRLYGRHGVRIFRFVMRLVQNRATAEELVNEVFVEIWQHAGRYEGRSTPTTWMMSIAHNKAVSSLRKRREATGVDETAMAEVPDLDDDPEQTTQKQDKGRIMRTCIARLSPDHREILDLVYYQELSVGEAAEVLGIPENTVKTRMFYARKKLSELLVERGIDRGWP